MAATPCGPYTVTSIAASVASKSKTTVRRRGAVFDAATGIVSSGEVRLKLGAAPVLPSRRPARLTGRSRPPLRTRLARARAARRLEARADERSRQQPPGF